MRFKNVFCKKHRGTIFSVCKFVRDLHSPEEEEPYKPLINFSYLMNIKLPS